MNDFAKCAPIIYDVKNLNNGYDAEVPANG